MRKSFPRLVLFLLLGVSCLIAGCAEFFKIPATYPPGVKPSPTAQPIPQTQPSDPAFPPGASTADKVEALTARVNTIASTIAATSPPGTPIHTGAIITAAISGVLLSGNELLKKLFGKNQPPGQ